AGADGRGRLEARPGAVHLARRRRGHRPALRNDHKEPALITVDFSLFPVGPGDRVLDLGCGGGRHAFEVYRRGADITAFDQNENDLADVSAMFAAMRAEGEGPEGATAETVKGDALAMPF